MPDFGDAVDPSGGRYEFQGQRDPNDVSLSPEEWAAYQARRRRDAILGVLGFLGGAMGGSALSYGLGGYGAAAGGGFASVPGAVGSATAPLGGGTVTAGAGAGLGGVAGAAGGVAPRVFDQGREGLNHAMGGGGGFLGMNPMDWITLATGLTGTIGGAMAGRDNQNAMQPNTSTTDPNLQRLLATMQGRLDKSEPLLDSIFSMANGLLPTQYQNGGRGGGGMP